VLSRTLKEASDSIGYTSSLALPIVFSAITRLHFARLFVYTKGRKKKIPEISIKHVEIWFFLIDWREHSEK